MEPDLTDEQLGELDISNLDDEGNVKPDDEIKLKDLPADFKPEEYGLPTPDAYQKMQQDNQSSQETIENLNKRLADTQTAFRDNQTSYNQTLAQIQQQMSNIQQQQMTQVQPQQMSSQQAYQVYAANPNDPVAYQNYLNAQIQENITKTFQPKLDQLSQQVQQQNVLSQTQAERHAIQQHPNYKDVNFVEMESSFDPTKGGRVGSYEEMILVHRARQEGGVQQFIQKMKRTGGDELLAKIRKAKDGDLTVQTLAKSGKKGKDVKADAPIGEDWDNLSDEQVLAEAKRLEQQGVIV